MIDIDNLTLKIEEIIQKERDSHHDIQYLNQAHSRLISQIISNYGLAHTSETKPNAEMIFLGAPTGAGKDVLARKLIANNPDKNYIVLNMDMFRHYHDEIFPEQELLSDKNFAEKTNQTSYELYHIIQEVILNEFPGTNIIVTGTIRDLQWVKEIVKRYKEDSRTNYHTSLVTLAVPTKESAFSIFERYLNMVDTRESSGIPLRYTALSYHNDTVSKFLSNVHFFEDNLHSESEYRYFDSIKVYRRNRDILDFSEDTLVYDSNNPDTAKCAYAHLHEIMNSVPSIDNNRVSQLLTIIKENAEYLKSEDLYKSILDNLESIVPQLNKDSKKTLTY